jgi:hypothetical protein
MLSPRAVSLLLKHFDSLDKALAQRLSRKNPWPEEALSVFLCDLLDSETQGGEQLDYSLAQLLSDLAQSDEPLFFRARIESHKYPTSLERYVTQSDIGLVVALRDQFEPGNSFSNPWLLQAKRVFPNRPHADGLYDASASFSSRDAAQEQRMRALRDWAGFDFIQYMLYCPRPSNLPKHVREVLTHHRTAAVAGDIFDYTLGLLLREDILTNAPTTAAGIFVAAVDSCPKNLGEVHRRLMHGSTPFSWFLIEQFARDHSRRRPHDLGRHPGTANVNPNMDAIERLVRGDHRVLDDIDFGEHFDMDAPPKILPVHTLDIEVIYGTDRPRNEPKA